MISISCLMSGDRLIGGFVEGSSHTSRFPSGLPSLELNGVMVPSKLVAGLSAEPIKGEELGELLASGEIGWSNVGV